MDERFVLPSAKRISATIIPNEHARVMTEEVIPIIGLAGDLCCSTDAWQNKARQHLTTINLHLISPTTAEMVAVNVQTKAVGDHEDATAIAGHLRGAFESLGGLVPARVIYGTSDRASNQSSGIRASGATAMYCNVHILSTIIKHAIKKSTHLHISTLVAKSHKLSIALRDPKLKHAWHRLQQEDTSTNGVIKELIPHMDIRFLTIEITLMRIMNVR